MQFENGDVYDGVFENNQIDNVFEGEGTFHSTRMQSKYEGSFKNGAANGNGIYKCRGRIYEGEWLDGMRVGV